MSGNNKSFCCPESKVLTEEVCGVLQGPIDQVVWTAPSPSDYFQGTFTVTNTGTTSFIFSVNDVVYTVPPGNTVSVSANNPANFIVTLVDGDTGKYCITLYKRFFV